MKYSILTFGCRVNQADSLGFEEDFLARGAEAVPPEHADVVVVNTCSVTSSADQAARQAIRRVARINPHARIVVTGCYATRRPDDVQALPNVIRVVPNGDKPRLTAFLSTAERFGDGEGSCGAAIEPGVAGRTAFTLRVQTGCAEPCWYCIIPATRGTPRSVPLQEILREVERVEAAGFREIVLTGVHLGSYGRDLSHGASLLDMLEALDGFARTRRSSGAEVLFRISSLEPMDCTAAVVDIVADSDALAPHFHLPLQHASDRVLEAMRRPYTLEYYAALVDRIRRRIPHASIGSDVIVGFPGEADEDFDRLASYLAASPLTHLHVFPYSDRPGTAAAAMSGRVDGTLVRERSRRLREISERLSSGFRAAQVGTVRRALTIDDGSVVVTDNYLKLPIPAGRRRNQWLTVKVTEDGGIPLADHAVEPISPR